MDLPWFLTQMIGMAKSQRLRCWLQAPIENYVVTFPLVPGSMSWIADWTA
jgi:hypothetical protein